MSLKSDTSHVFQVRHRSSPPRQPALVNTETPG